MCGLAMSCTWTQIRTFGTSNAHLAFGYRPLLTHETVVRGLPKTPPSSPKPPPYVRLALADLFVHGVFVEEFTQAVGTELHCGKHLMSHAGPGEFGP